MATCKECGVQIPDESRFCWHCGAPQKEPRPERPSVVWMRRHASLVSVASYVVVFGAMLGLIFLHGVPPYWAGWVATALIFAVGLGVDCYHSLHPGRPERSNAGSSALVVGIVLVASFVWSVSNGDFQDSRDMLIKLLICATGATCYTVGYWTGYRPTVRTTRKQPDREMPSRDAGSSCHK